ncbi:MAG: 30S ribosome-binding factor RbfA [Planctomycetota bacterium]|nr:30S ribosome-binding factor RbfA [Planctomycetota bacterium]
MRKNAGRGESDDATSAIRGAQVASRLTRLLQERLVRGLSDPRFQGMVSVLGVEMAPRTDEAVVRVSVLPDSRGRLALAALQSAAPRLRADVMGPMRLRKMPRLRFELDDSLKKMDAIGDVANPPSSEDQS